MHNKIKSHFPEVSAQLAHDIQSRIMRLQSLQFLLRKLHQKEQTTATRNEIAERSERLATTLSELTTLTQLQSVMLTLVTAESLVDEERKEARNLAQRWAALGERQQVVATQLEQLL